MDGEFDEQEVGIMIQYIVLEPEHAQIRTGSANGGIDFGYVCGRELLAQPGQSLRSPAVLGSDAAA